MAKQEKAKGITRQAFLNLLGQGRLQGAWLLEGTEVSLRDAAVAEVRRTLLPTGLEDLNAVTLSAPDADSLIAACETMPFMADMRLVTVTDAAGLTGRPEAEDRLAEYLPKVPPTCLALFLLSAPADSRKKLTKAFMDLKHVVTFAPMDERELGGWIIAQFAAQGKTCDPAAAQELILASGTDSQRLSGEIAKLSALAEGDFISRELVRGGAARTAEYTVFQMLDAVLAGQETRAFLLLRSLLENGEDRLGILALLSRQYRQLQQYKILVHEKVPPQEYAERLGVQGFMVDRLRRQSAAVSGREVKAAVEACIDTEYRVKSGRLNENGSLEALLLRLFTAHREAAARNMRRQ